MVELGGEGGRGQRGCGVVGKGESMGWQQWGEVECVLLPNAQTLPKLCTIYAQPMLDLCPRHAQHSQLKAASWHNRSPPTCCLSAFSASASSLAPTPPAASCTAVALNPHPRVLRATPSSSLLLSVMATLPEGTGTGTGTALLARA